MADKAITRTHFNANDPATKDKLAAAFSDEYVLNGMKAAIRNEVTPTLLASFALSAINRVPKLQECTLKSVLASMVKCLQMGLEPDGWLAHLVPYKSECTLIPDYKGYAQLAYRSGLVKDIVAENIFSNEEYQLDLSTGRKVLFHHPLPPSKRGEYIGSYAIARTTNGGEIGHWMWAEQVWAVRDRSASANSSYSPWKHQDDQWQMTKKTAVRGGAKLWPVSPEFRQALALDDAADTGTQASMIDVDFKAVFGVSAETGQSQGQRMTDRARSITGKPPETKTQTQAAPESGAVEQPAQGSPPPAEGGSDIIGSKRARALFNLIGTAAADLREQILTDYKLSKVALEKDCQKLTEAQANAIEELLTAGVGA